MTNKKWVLVTGGSRGIGAAVVSKLAQSCDVIFTWQQNAQQAEAVKKNCRALPGRVLSFQCDGRDEEQVSVLASQLLAQHGAPAGIVHNAGVTKDALHIHQTTDDWQGIIDSNLNAIFYWNRQLIPSMFIQGGSIVMMSSVSAIKGNAGQVAYSATKAAMLGITRSLSREVARFNVRINCVLPGFINTEMTSNLSSEECKRLKSHIPMRRMGTPDEVAQAVDFLLADASSYITGQSLIIDGGMTA